MSQLVANGALLVCSMGTAQSQLVVLRRNYKAQVQGLANVMDFQGVTNIPSFGACVSPANPAVQYAGGTPQPCLPVITGPWTPGCGHVTQNIEGTTAPVAALTADSMCRCAWAGQIVITNANTHIMV